MMRGPNEIGLKTRGNQNRTFSTMYIIEYPTLFSECRFFEINNYLSILIFTPLELGVQSTQSQSAP